MDEREFRRLIAALREGRVSRRTVLGRLVGLGLAAPFANLLLIDAGAAQTAGSAAYAPKKAGGGGTLKTLWWEAPTLLNPHFAVGTKDQDASRIFYEPLASWDADGLLVPILATKVPSREDGDVAADGKSVIWRIKKGVTWHDGQPFTADDVVFNWQYATDPATAATTIGAYKDTMVEKLDPFSVRVRFAKPTPFWAMPFVGTLGMIIPKHLFAAYTGVKSRQAPANLKPVGTGPYRFVSFTPGDLVRGERNPSYHEPDRPYFDAIEMKGGGDAVSAARAVIQTGEYDYAWNLQVEDEILSRLEKTPDAHGRVALYEGGAVEHIELNSTDPWTVVDGEFSSAKTKHPLLSDPAVREALGLLIDRDGVHKYIYGRTGLATGNYINNPKPFVSKNTRWEFNVQKANEVLDAAGWKRGADEVRAKDGKRLKLVFQTSVNAPRQQNQEIIKQDCAKAGIAMELKAITASVYFSSDVANPDTYRKFHADLQMYTIGMAAPDPQDFMRQFLSSEIAQKSNKWQGRNVTRWHSPQYDAQFHAAESELDPVKRAALFIKMNDMVVGDHAVIPEIYRLGVSGIAKNLKLALSGWDSNFSFLKDWYRTTT
ncbi:MAG: peptide ABC transporter substrate-binding protein [Stellaceae bacterium]